MNAQAEVDLVDEMKPLLSDSVTVPRSARWRLISRSAVSICANPADTADCSRAPSPVSRKPCEDLVHRRMPRLSSSRPTMRLTATCVTCNSSAARVKLRHLAAASNTRSAFADRIRSLSTVAIGSSITPCYLPLRQM